MKRCVYESWKPSLQQRKALLVRVSQQGLVIWGFGNTFKFPFEICQRPELWYRDIPTGTDPPVAQELDIFSLSQMNLSY